MGRKIYSMLGDPEMIAAGGNLREAIDRDGRGLPAIAEAAGLTTKRLELFSTDLGPMRLPELASVCEVLGVDMVDVLELGNAARL